MKPSRKLLVGALALLCLRAALSAENWPHWRGPNFNGSAAEQKLPADFSKTNHVQWVAALPGPAAATPIIWGDHVFVSSTDLRTKTLRALALDRRTGKELWNQEIAPGFKQDDRSNLASPSPVTDGELVYFFYGTGDLVAFDFAGHRVWARNLQKEYGSFAFNFTFGSSPTLFDEQLFVQVLQRNVPVHGRGQKDGPNDSYLLALAPKTGQEIWKHIRPSEAHEESREAYSTPIPFAHAGRREILVIGGDCITGHSLKDGAEYWRWGSWNPDRITHWRLVPSPVTGGDAVLACAPKGSPVFAVKAGSQGSLDDSGLAWTSAEREVSSDVGTPLFYQGRFYVVNGDKKNIARIDPTTGKAEWIGDLGTRVKIESSPTGADGKIYFQNFRGEVFVVAAAPEFKLLHVAAMGDEDDNDLRATIAVAQGSLFIRTGSKLYCVGL